MQRKQSVLPETDSQDYLGEDGEDGEDGEAIEAAVSVVEGDIISDDDEDFYDALGMYLVFAFYCITEVLTLLSDSNFSITSIKSIFIFI
jgi:hypothetical protein